MPIAFLDACPEAAPHGILISLHPRVERIARRIYNVPLWLVLRGLPASGST